MHFHCQSSTTPNLEAYSSLDMTHYIPDSRTGNPFPFDVRAVRIKQREERKKDDASLFCSYLHTFTLKNKHMKTTLFYHSTSFLETSAPCTAA